MGPPAGVSLGRRRNEIALTARGGAVLAASVGGLLATILLGIGELAYPAVAGAFVLLAGLAWVSVRPGALQCVRILRPPRLTEGDTALVELVITNADSHRSRALWLQDPFDSGGATATPNRKPSALLYVAPIGAGAQLSKIYRISSLRRGFHLIGPLDMTLTDPFGLLRRTRFGAAQSQLFVRPHLLAVEATRAGGGSGPGAGNIRRRDINAEEFATLRPYREGDDLRHVHWPSSARLNDMMVKQGEAVRQGRCSLALDVRSHVWRVNERGGAERFEAVLGAVGGVLRAAWEGGNEIRFTTTDGTDSGYGSSTGHWNRILDGLATVFTNASGPHKVLGVALPPLFGPGTPQNSETATVVTSTVVTASAAGPVDVESLAQRRSSVLVVAFEVGPTGLPIWPKSEAGAGPDVVVAGDPLAFARTWRSFVSSPQTRAHGFRW